ncbi:alcohol dehydrogenase [Thioclava sp. F34-6]|uniref:iron-containing alcohol dehydrogenase n=1 Tax=Thioclava sp. F34-6 TaxID=1973003 RepID=UPI000B53AEBC|nr:iron-containing alcohol dehydrogenase [Thioclava sp. F34-6]OWY07840.1 alcohol dehydrogenase [Thioclava sp. F34-6]
MDFALRFPGRILFGRDERHAGAELIARYGARVALVRGRSVGWADTLEDTLREAGRTVEVIVSRGEPSYPDLCDALGRLREMRPDCVVAVGGGAVLDLGKALAALIPAASDPIVHFELVGEGRPLSAPPLPFVAIPTTAGTGAEATRNAVIQFPEHRRKVSLRDDRMMAALAIVDPALTDRCPRAVTLASGLDALTQVIEPYLCSRANILTDALCRDAIPRAIHALVQLMARESTDARDDMARASLFGGVALGNAGLGAVHGFAGVIGGRSGAAHGAICGRLLPGVLQANRAAVAGDPAMAARFHEVAGWLGEGLAVAPADAFTALERQIDEWGLPRLGAMGVDPDEIEETARLSRSSSSMAANPVPLSKDVLSDILRAAF